MSKPNVIENKAFQQSNPISGGFHLAPQVNTFNSIFETKPLDEAEASKIVQLVEYGRSDDVEQEQAERDANNLKQITAEIKAIGKQGAILLGERVHRARELLKPYKDGTFTRWLESAFGTRKTGYNVLSYYELHQALPPTAREKFKSLQQRTAYILASRSGDIEVKAEIVANHHNKPHEELVTLIREKLPADADDKRAAKVSIARLLSSIELNVTKLRDNMDSITPSDREQVATYAKWMEELINE